MIKRGFHTVEKGNVATIVTYLEMRTAPEGQNARPLADGVSLRKVDAPSLDWYRDVFSRVGTPWLWWSRLLLSDQELTEILHHPAVDVIVLEKDGKAEGLLELDFREAGSCELAYFGLTDALIGTGAGRFLMSEAITRAFARDIDLFHVHTCTLDSAQALGFYRRSGFTPVRQDVEIAADPRLSGLLPRDAGAHVPMFE